MDEFTRGAVLTLMGATLGFVAGRWELWIERRGRRRTLATALLSELRALNSMARQIYKSGHPASLEYLAHPVLEGALGRVDLFSAQTASELTQLNAVINTLTVHIDHIFRYRPTGTLEEMAEFYVKGNSYYLAHQISEVVPLLVAAGGTMPVLPRPTPISSDNIPELPKNLFVPYGNLDA